MVVDRIIMNSVLDVLRENRFMTAKDISKKRGLDLETIKETLRELKKQKLVGRYSED